MLGMSTIIPSTGSCQVELVNPGTAMILECHCLHDRTDFHKKKNSFFASKFCQEPSQRLQTALLSENGRRYRLPDHAKQCKQESGYLPGLAAICRLVLSMIRYLR